MAQLVRTITSIADRIRRRCDQEGSTFVSNTELFEEINASYAELFDFIHDSAATEGFLVSTDTTTSAGVDLVTISSVFTVNDPDTGDVDQYDAYRIAGVDVKFSGRWRSIGKWRFTDRNRNNDERGWSGPGDTFYRLHDHNRENGRPILRLYPTPPGTFDLRVWYMPIAPEAATYLDVVAFNGWDDFIVYDVAAKVLEKEESDSDPLWRRRQKALERVVWAASQLDDSGVEGIREVVNWGTGSTRFPNEEDSEYSL